LTHRVILPNYSILIFSELDTLGNLEQLIPLAHGFPIHCPPKGEF
jgi:hypothetical protein